MDFNLDEYLKDFINQWKEAEETIKIAERVRNEAVFPAIQELRYAGRRIVQVFDIINTAKLENLPLSEAQVKECHRHATEAVENCYKAKQDSIDAAIMFVHGEVDYLVKQAGVETVLNSFSELKEIRSEMITIDKLIIDSRANRLTLEERYDTITKKHLEKFCSLFENLLSKNEIIEAVARQNEKDSKKQEQRNFNKGLITGVISSAFVSGVILIFS